MTRHSSHARTRLLLTVLVLCTAFLALTMADQSLWRTFRLDEATKSAVMTRDWYQSLRQLGYVPVWMLMALVLMAHDRAIHRRLWWDRGLMVFSSAFFSGMLAEIFKGIFMRQRPGSDGLYWFSWMNEGFAKGPGHGLPSSHAAVAFGAAFVIARLFAGSGPPILLAALGCGISRMLMGAHFATDVALAALVGWCASRIVWQVHEHWRFVSHA